MLTNKSGILLCVLFSLSPVFWFPIIGKILILKFFLLAIIAIVNIKYFHKLTLQELLPLIIAVVLFVIVLSEYQDSFFEQWINVYFNIICAYIIYMIGKNDSFERSKQIFKNSCNIVCLYCLLLFICIVFNLIPYFPQEYSRELSNGMYQEIPLFISGWGFGSTQWSTCLSIFVSAHFIAFDERDKRKRLFLGIIIVVTTQMMCGGRGGILASIITLSLFLFFRTKNKLLFVIYGLLTTVILFWISSTYADHFRLNREHLSQERELQWTVLFIILSKLPLKGFGFYGGDLAMEQFGILAFHDSLLRCLLGFGIAGLYVDSIIVYITSKSIFILNRNNLEYYLPYSLLLISGFICTFTEPNPIVSSFYWIPWWYIAGLLSKDSIPSYAYGSNEPTNDLTIG